VQRLLLLENVYAQIKVPHKIGIDSNILNLILAKGWTYVQKTVLNRKR